MIPKPETQTKDAVQLLAEINERLKRMQPLTFSELSPYEQQMAFTIAIDKASLAEIYDIEQTDAHCIAIRRQKEQAELQSRITSAKIAGNDGIDELRKQVDYGELGAQFAKRGFEKSKGDFGA